MARKPYPSEMQERFIVRFPDGMRDQITAAARSNNRTMNSEIVARLQQSFDPAGDDAVAARSRKAMESVFATMQVTEGFLAATLVSVIDRLEPEMREAHAHVRALALAIENKDTEGLIKGFKYMFENDSKISAELDEIAEELGPIIDAKKRGEDPQPHIDAHAAKRDAKFDALIARLDGEDVPASKAALVELQERGLLPPDIMPPVWWRQRREEQGLPLVTPAAAKKTIVVGNLGRGEGDDYDQVQRKLRTEAGIAPFEPPNKQNLAPSKGPVRSPKTRGPKP